MKFDKLVRDRIPEIIAESGKRAIFRVLRKDEFWSYLEKKLDEEIAELRECTTDEERKEELEDIRDVVVAMMQFIIEEQGKTPLEHFSEIISAKSKRTERGGFDQRICLLEIEDEE